MEIHSLSRIQKLPMLAWLFLLSGSGETRLVHGNAVEITDDGFFEGCFSGEWKQDFTQISNVFGSGIRISERHCTLVTPSHTLESIFLYRHRDGWGVSNSLALLLEYYKIEMPWDPHYGGKFASVTLGIKDYQKLLFRTSDGEVLRVTYDNVEFTAAGEYRLIDKPIPPSFDSYQSYVGYLEATLRKALTIAAKPERQSVYQPLPTCSTGYDSPAGAALARRFGCTESVTVRTARGGASDSGRPIGELLGLKVQEVDRPEIVSGSFAQAAPFLATGMGGEDYCFSGFTPFLKNKVLLTGFHGDKIWEANVEPNAVMARGDVSGSSLQEFRIWNNFLHIPVPMIGALRHANIAAISHSSELAPYRLHNHYDRPIPRRIIEESGIPRDLFGQIKKAASILLFSQPNLFDDASLHECESLVSAAWVASAKSPLRDMVWHGRIRAYNFIKKVARLVPAAEAVNKIVMPDWRIFEHDHPMASLEFCAAIAKIRADYRTALIED
jgi:hypothetical protein